MKETYNNAQIMLKRISFPAQKQFVSADLKVVAILTGLQLGCTKYCHWVTPNTTPVTPNTATYGTQGLAVNITPENSGLQEWYHSLVSTTLSFIYWFHNRKLYFKPVCCKNYRKALLYQEYKSSF